ncbi:MAG: LysR family transcriptional regulator [Burkholderiaceae bacterium]
MALPTHRSVLSADNLGLLEAISRLGSMAAAARELGMVPSALTYRVRQIEDALDVLLFDRSARRARLTPAGAELLQSGQHLLDELDAVARRVKRVATGWEPQFTVAADAIIPGNTLFELFESFYAQGAPTRLRLRAETLSGTLESLLSGKADLAVGFSGDINSADIRSAPLGTLDFVFAVAPHHPLASVGHPLDEEERAAHRAVAVADSTQRGRGGTRNIAPGQDVLTVPSMEHKLQAQLMGLGAGYLPVPLAKPYVNAGRLVVKAVQGPPRQVRLSYAWRQPRGPVEQHRALSWWLEQLQHGNTREALLSKHALM